MLDKLHKQHEDIKLAFFKKKYLQLKDGKERNHFERVIAAIEGVLLTYQIKPCEFKKNLTSIDTEVNFAVQHKSKIFSEEVYCVSLNEWWFEIKKQADKKVEESKGFLNISAYNESDYSFIYEGLKEEYERYSQKNPLLMIGRQNKCLEVIKNDKDRIAAPQRILLTKHSILDLPLPILSLIFSFIVHPNDLLNLELVNILFKSIVSNSKSWETALNQKFAEEASMNQQLTELKSVWPTLRNDDDRAFFFSKCEALEEKSEASRYFVEVFKNLAWGAGTKKKGAAFNAEKPKDKYRQTFLESKHRRHVDKLFKELKSRPRIKQFAMS